MWQISLSDVHLIQQLSLLMVRTVILDKCLGRVLGHLYRLRWWRCVALNLEDPITQRRDVISRKNRPHLHCREDIKIRNDYLIFERLLVESWLEHGLTSVVSMTGGWQFWRRPGLLPLPSCSHNRITSYSVHLWSSVNDKLSTELFLPQLRSPFLSYLAICLCLIIWNIAYYVFFMYLKCRLKHPLYTNAWTIPSSPLIFIHSSVICQTTGSQPLPKLILSPLK